MNSNYHKCLSVCKHIQQRMGAAIQTALTPQLLVATADKLIYNHAIEMVSFCVVCFLFQKTGSSYEKMVVFKTF